MKARPSKRKNASKNSAWSKDIPLFAEELSDMYWSEKALTIAIPEMIKNAESEWLRKCLENHLQDANDHVDKIFSMLGDKLEEKGGEEMEMIILQAKEFMKNGMWCYERVVPVNPLRSMLNATMFRRNKRFERSA